MSMAIKVLNGLTNILKKTDPKMPDSNVVNWVYEFVDKIHNSRGNGDYGACLYVRTMARPLYLSWGSWLG